MQPTQLLSKCPLCDTELTWIPSDPLFEQGQNTTHIYTCSECPFVGFEYSVKKNIDDLIAYLNK